MTSLLNIHVLTGKNSMHLPCAMFVLFNCVVSMCAAEAGVPDVTVSSKDLFSEIFPVADALVQMVDLPVNSVTVPPMKSVNGKELFILEETGLLHQVAIPEGRETRVLNLHAKTGQFAQSKDGLMVYLPATKELLAIDEQSFKIVHRVPLPACKGLAAAAGSSLVYATDGRELTVINAAKGQTVRHINALDLLTTYAARIKKHSTSSDFSSFDNPVLSPDGRNLICRSSGSLRRFRCDGTDLVYEEAGANFNDNGGDIQISEDGAWVAQAVQGDRPGSKAQLTDAEEHFEIYKSSDLLRLVTLVRSEGYPHTLAFDKQAGKIYTKSWEQQLVVFTADGVKQKGYHFIKDGRTLWILAFSAGCEALVGTDRGIFWVEMPDSAGVVRGSHRKQSTGWLQPLVQVTAKSTVTVPAKRVPDEKGQERIEMTSIGQLAPLGDDVTGIAAAPSGEALYVIHRNDPIVGVVDPATWKVVAEIPVAQTPVSVWCDGALIAVACEDSKVVVLIDPLKREVLRSVGCPTNPDWRPLQICGRAPNGGIVSRWQTESGDRGTQRLVNIGLDGTVQMIGEESRDGDHLQAGVWLPEGRVFFGQTYNSGSILIQPDTKVPPLELRKGLFPDNKDFDELRGPAFITQDNASLVFPRRCQTNQGVSFFRTFLLAPRLDFVQLQVMGAAICEVPDRRLLITLDREIREPAPGSRQERLMAQVRYIARDTGQVLRVVHLEPEAGIVEVEHIQRSRYRWCYTEDPTKGAVYIPGHELLLIPEKTDAKSLSFTVFRCGPPAGVADIVALAPATLGNEPPAVGKPGVELRYQPNAPAAGGKRSAYRIKRPLPGMAIDTTTGAWTWTPNSVQVGTWQVTILATSEGKETALATWSLTVR